MKDLTKCQHMTFVFITILFVSFIITIISLNNQLERADAVIEQVRQDNPDYYYDVLVEGETYQDYLMNI